ncbi:MAG: hypothetical protein WHS88_09945, partial [Anaerohalosphaeraceae bacterium]
MGKNTFRKASEASFFSLHTCSIIPLVFCSINKTSPLSLLLTGLFQKKCTQIFSEMRAASALKTQKALTKTRSRSLIKPAESAEINFFPGSLYLFTPRLSLKKLGEILEIREAMVDRTPAMHILLWS